MERGMCVDSVDSWDNHSLEKAPEVDFSFET